MSSAAQSLGPNRAPGTAWTPGTVWTRSALLSCLLALAACTGPGAPEVPVDPPGEFGPDHVHVVTHEHGQCPICGLYERVRPAVILIRTDTGLGSGVCINAGGAAITNAHVVGALPRVGIEFSDGRIGVARVAGADVGLDLALLFFEEVEGQPADSLSFPYLPVEGGHSAPVGTEVFLVGHPLGLTWSVTRGIVSGFRDDGNGPMIQTDAALSPGNSGGPLLDVDGHVLGIATSKVIGRGAENLSFVRPAASVIGFLDQWMPAMDAGALVDPIPDGAAAEPGPGG